MLGLYINIPFYNYISNEFSNELLLNPSEDEINNYIDHLIKEIKGYSIFFPRIKTIYIGGGVPSILNSNQLLKLLKYLEILSPVEFTFEVDVSNITLEKAQILSNHGVNRISLKINTFNNQLLKTLNKPYEKKDIIKAIKIFKEVKIKNINIDLTFGIPNQTLIDIKNDLKEVKKHLFSHVSFYELDIQEDSYFDKKDMCLEHDLKMNMFKNIINDLKNIRYKHYEITHFTYKEQYSLHNTLYWTLEEYIGTGLGAHSFINNKRLINNSNLISYYENPIAEIIPQTKKDNIENYLIFGLRQLRGINIVDFKNKYKVDILEQYPKLNDYINDGILQLKDNNLSLTKEGIFYSNLVFEVFIWNISLKIMSTI